MWYNNCINIVDLKEDLLCLLRHLSSVGKRDTFTCLNHPPLTGLIERNWKYGASSISQMALAPFVIVFVLSLGTIVIHHCFVCIPTYLRSHLEHYFHIIPVKPLRALLTLLSYHMFYIDSCARCMSFIIVDVCMRTSYNLCKCLSIWIACPESQSIESTSDNEFEQLMDKPCYRSSLWIFARLITTSLG